jgi:23S rRNA pseudouridine955/2504/2580 synthase
MTTAIKSTATKPGRGDAAVAERVAPSTGVQTAKVSADEAGMRVDRFLEARFPGLSFSHIQRVIRKGELRVNGKRAQPKQRLEAGQAVRIPPLRLDQPRPRSPENEADAKTRDFLKSITLHEDADVLVLNKPMGLAVQGGSGTTRHLDGMPGAARRAGPASRLVHRLDKDTAGCLLVAKTGLRPRRSPDVPHPVGAKVYWALVAGVPKPRQGRISTYLAKEEREDDSFMRIARHGEEGASHAVTYYAVVDTAARQLAWLSLKPVTGRTHQLRAHMAHVGHPSWAIEIFSRTGSCPAACRTGCICWRAASSCRIRAVERSISRRRCRTCSSRGISSVSIPNATIRSRKHRKNNAAGAIGSRDSLMRADGTAAALSAHPLLAALTRIFIRAHDHT